MHNDSFFSQHAIREGGFANIGPSNNGKFNASVYHVCWISSDIGFWKQCLNQAGNTVAVYGGNCNR